MTSSQLFSDHDKTGEPFSGSTSFGAAAIKQKGKLIGATELGMWDLPYHSESDTGWPVPRVSKRSIAI